MIGVEVEDGKSLGRAGRGGIQFTSEDEVSKIDSVDEVFLCRHHCTDLKSHSQPQFTSCVLSRGESLAMNWTRASLSSGVSAFVTDNNRWKNTMKINDCLRNPSHASAEMMLRYSSYFCSAEVIKFHVKKNWKWWQNPTRKKKKWQKLLQTTNWLSSRINNSVETKLTDRRRVKKNLRRLLESFLQSYINLKNWSDNAFFYLYVNVCVCVLYFMWLIYIPTVYTFVSNISLGQYKKGGNYKLWNNQETKKHTRCTCKLWWCQGNFVCWWIINHVRTLSRQIVTNQYTISRPQDV